MLFVLLSYGFSSPDISDSEICLAGYSVTRLDRNMHGGSIALYNLLVKHCLLRSFPQVQKNWNLFL